MPKIRDLSRNERLRLECVRLPGRGLTVVQVAEVSFTSNDRVRDVIHNAIVFDGFPCA
ncbi:hypothetical protein ACIHCQ_01560 [Streptomyces sp. NPDC052236]|uniref:hypothetical protein n=1 Tax=Streptomyces sp. NPDC052236 TaxID=3365686 RepID=UPI0037CCD8F1